MPFIPYETPNSRMGYPRKYNIIVFDIGQTLIEYELPLNWSKLYRPAFENIANTYDYKFTEQHYQYVNNVLTKYNTRINPRDYKVSSTHIFSEILSGMNIPIKDMKQVKDCFYSYFRRNASPFPEVEQTLKMLSAEGILLGTLSDVAYGMDNIYALEDIAPLRKYIDYPFTSNDVGYRKPCPKGLKMLSEKMKINISNIIFVGDEKKDMLCAIHAGAYPILINRENTIKNYGQSKEIHSFIELLDIIHEKNKAE